MANLKVFVSSTCYDLNVVRSQLRNFILEFGYEPVMSDYSDVLYDPRNHTHESCVQEVQFCDMLVVIIGSRFGGKAIPKAREQVNLDGLKEKSKGEKFLEEHKKDMSITQLEVLRAIELGIPVFTFVDSGVWHDHNVYEKNKDKGIVDEIEFPSIDKRETAKYIFEFINFLRLRTENNSISVYAKLDDIQMNLSRQWSGLFQRLLNEQKNKRSEEIKMDFLTSQIADLKTALMTSIQNPELKSAAQGALKYRRLIDFFVGINGGDKEALLKELSWEDLLAHFGIEEILPYELSIGVERFGNRTMIRMQDGKWFGSRVPIDILVNDLSSEWAGFVRETPSTKEAVIDAILTTSNGVNWLKQVDVNPATSRMNEENTSGNSDDFK